MTTADKEIIRDAGRGVDRVGAEMFKQKVTRDNAYRLYKGGQMVRFTDAL